MRSSQITVEPLSPELAGGFFTTEPPGKPLQYHFKTWIQGYNPLLQPSILRQTRAVSRRQVASWVASDWWHWVSVFISLGGLGFLDSLLYRHMESYHRMPTSDLCFFQKKNRSSSRVSHLASPWKNLHGTGGSWGPRLSPGRLPAQEDKEEFNLDKKPNSCRSTLSQSVKFPGPFLLCFSTTAHTNDNLTGSRLKN